MHAWHMSLVASSSPVLFSRYQGNEVNPSHHKKDAALNPLAVIVPFLAVEPESISSQ